MQQLYEVVAGLAAALNTPVGDEISNLIKTHKWQELKHLQIPMEQDPDSFWAHSQARDLLLKVEGLPGAPSERELKESCLAEFYRCEAANFVTNKRLEFIYSRDMAYLRSDHDERLREFLLKVKKQIRGLLGPLPDIEELRARFGPGATFCLQFPRMSLAEKLQNVPSYTLDAWPYLLDWIGTAWGKAALRVNVDSFPGGVIPQSSVRKIKEPERVRGNRWTTVPKDSFKRRGICVEPALNVFYQLGYGTYFRTLLKRKWGLDLQNDQDKHREMAREGSLSGSLATIDLSSASDLISKKLVEYLLPRRWVTVLNSLRSPYSRVNGKWVRLEKFSSMGNGYTFELETIIFHAIVRTIAAEKWPDVDPTDWVKTRFISQYGDDCIVPEEIADVVLAAFKMCGFQVNKTKTYTSGPFRESCGGDYHSGVDVRTFKLKELPDAPEKWISFANGLWAVANPNSHNPYRLAFIRKLHRFCLGNIPSHLRRLKGPDHLGDLVVHSLPADWQAPLVSGGIAYFRGYLPVSNLTPWNHFPPNVVLAAALCGATSDGCPWPDPPVKGHRVRWIGKPRSLRVKRGEAKMRGD